jgi:hypothetical protein
LVDSALGSHRDDAAFQMSLYRLQQFLLSPRPLPRDALEGGDAAVALLTVVESGAHPAVVDRLLSILAVLSQKFDFVVEPFKVASVLSGIFATVPGQRVKIVQFLSVCDFSVLGAADCVVDVVLNVEFMPEPVFITAVVNLFYRLSAFQISWEGAARVLDFVLSGSGEGDLLRIWTVFRIVSQHGPVMQSYLEGVPSFYGFVADAFGRSDDLAHASILVLGGIFGARCTVPGFDDSILVAALSHPCDKVKITGCFAAVNFILSQEFDSRCSSAILARFIEMLTDDGESFLVKQEAGDALVALVCNGGIAPESVLDSCFFAAVLAAGKICEEWMVDLLNWTLDCAIVGQLPRFLGLLNEIRGDEQFQTCTSESFSKLTMRIAELEATMCEG